MQSSGFLATYVRTYIHVYYSTTCIHLYMYRTASKERVGSVPLIELHCHGCTQFKRARLCGDSVDDMCRLIQIHSHELTDVSPLRTCFLMVGVFCGIRYLSTFYCMFCWSFSLSPSSSPHFLLDCGVSVCAFSFPGQPTAVVSDVF